MKKNYYLHFINLLFLLITIGSFESLHAQKRVQKPVLESMPGSHILEYATDLKGKHRIPPPEEYTNLIAKNGDPPANIQVTYVGFESAPEARVAFQTAVDIWSSLLKSSVTIHVEANWTTFTDDNVLGGASAGTFFRSVTLGSQFPRALTWYPVALAEKLARTDLNFAGDTTISNGDTTITPPDADIVASFNRNRTDWYFGTDGNTPANEFDFVSIVLHELGHGLGFISLTTFDENTGVGALLQGGTPAIFDIFVEDNSNQSLLNQAIYPDPSTALGDALQNSLFFDAPIVTGSQGGRTILFSPSTYDPGSSTSHLDNTVYSGTINSLMTPFATQGASEMDPGPVTLEMFADMGWVNTYIRPDTLTNTENIQATYPVTAIVLSDSTLNTGSVTLHYSKDTFNTETPVTMMPTGNENEYMAEIPGNVNGELIGYYVTAEDATNRTYFSPAEATELDIYFFFVVGTDNEAPVITHDPTTFITLNDTEIPLEAEIIDVIGVDTTNSYIEYSVNGVAQDSILLSLTGFNRYSATIPLDSFTLEDGDSLNYRIIAQDLAVAQNQSSSPTSGFYKIDVQGTATAQDSYENDFNDPSAADDFFGDSFSITTPTGFSNGAIHSDHPYLDGSGPNDESNYIFTLNIPIIINSTNPFMRFDEIALIEPGEPSTVFGDLQFWDFVIVEGSTDGGVSWTRLLDGYDAREESTWLSRYTSALDANTGISSATGTPDLYISRLIDISRTFNAGQEVLFRFRLFADQSAHGWGWAIDNLQIQGNVTSVEEFFGRNQEVAIFPNPSQGDLSIEAELLKQPKNLELEILNLQGKSLLKRDIKSIKPILSESIDLNSLPEGTYLVRIKTEGGVVTRRFVINR